MRSGWVDTYIIYGVYRVRIIIDVLNRPWRMVWLRVNNALKISNKYTQLFRTHLVQFNHDLVLSRQNWSPLKSVRPDRFWQKILPKLVPRTTFAAKIGPAGPILAAKTGPPLPILVPPVKINL